MIVRQANSPILLVLCFLFAAIATMAASSPNLTPYQPSSWSDKIVVSRTTGTATDSTSLTTEDTLYVDTALINNGDAATNERFWVELYVDGVSKKEWYSDPPTNPNQVRSNSDYLIGSLTAGQHTIKIKIDSRGNIAESNEKDNEYTKTITVTAGQTINGTLTDADADSHGRLGKKADYYTLTGSGNTTITLRSSAFDAYLYLYDQNKQQVAFNDDGGGGSDPRISYTLVSGQTYYVEATAYYNDGRGTYALTASSGTLTAVATPWPPTLPNLTPYRPPAWSDRIVVSRSTGSTTDDFDLTPADALYVNWAYYNESDAPTSVRNNTELYIDGVLRNTWYADPPVNPGPDSYRSVRDYSIGSLPSGQHTFKIKVDAYGAITESNENDNEYTKTITISAGQGINGILAEGDPDSHGRSGAKADYYTLTGSGSITISLRSSSFDAYLFLYNQNKQQISYDDDSAGDRNSRINYQLVAGQTYYVEVTSYFTDGRGAYFLTPSTGILTTAADPWPPEPPTQIVANASSIAGNITTSGQSDWYSFRTPIAGDYIIETDASGLILGTDTLISLYGPDTNTAFITSDDDSGNLWFSKITARLEANRTYHVKVGCYGQTTGPYTLTIRESTSPTLIFNLVISYSYNPTQSRLDELGRGMRQASNFLWLGTGKQARFGRVDVYRNGSHNSSAHLILKGDPYHADEDWRWNLSLIPPQFGRDQIFLGTMNDGGFSVAVVGGTFRTSAWDERAAYSTIVHEFGHLNFHVLDEYLTANAEEGGHCPDTGNPCVMENQFETPVGFCVPANHDKNQDTYQQKVRGESCFETMKREFSAFRIATSALAPVPMDIRPDQEAGPLLDFQVH